MKLIYQHPLSLCGFDYTLLSLTSSFHCKHNFYLKYKVLSVSIVTNHANICLLWKKNEQTTLSKTQGFSVQTVYDTRLHTSMLQHFIRTAKQSIFVCIIVLLFHNEDLYAASYCINKLVDSWQNMFVYISKNLCLLTYMFIILIFTQIYKKSGLLIEMIWRYDKLHVK